MTSIVQRQNFNPLISFNPVRLLHATQPIESDNKMKKDQKIPTTSSKNEVAVDQTHFRNNIVEKCSNITTDALFNDQIYHAISTNFSEDTKPYHTSECDDSGLGESIDDDFMGNETITSIVTISTSSQGRSSTRELNDCDEKIIANQKCKRPFKHSTRLKKHSKYNENVTFQCKHCSQIFPNKQLFETHKQKCGRLNYGCGLCDYYSSDMAEFIIHIRRHAVTVVGKPYKCDFCRKRFKQKAHAKIHMSRKHG